MPRNDLVECSSTLFSGQQEQKLEKGKQKARMPQVNADVEIVRRFQSNARITIFELTC